MLSDEFISVKDVAEMYGYTRSGLWRQLDSPDAPKPYFQKNSKYFNKAEIIEYFKKRRMLPAEVRNK